MKSAISLTTFVSAMLFLGVAAHADVPPPETEPCVGKQPGDACVYNGSGTCQNQTCSRLDYANWDQDASPSPPSTTYACVKCVAGLPTDTNTATDTSTSADGGEPPSDDDSGCSIGRRSATQRVVPWLLAAAFSLLFLRRRRRR